LVCHEGRVPRRDLVRLSCGDCGRDYVLHVAADRRATKLLCVARGVAPSLTVVCLVAPVFGRWTIKEL